ncbi:hypothetical protein TRFO_29338 [Tritrichomonas foetus]|uniref:Uncharacterized protein n=1 Tax=Tritrichomonas foetus TaxID=1144522 RepID=A0A1J4JVY3_9EUKA|nr:hypothetical protein TRFO_29338 [Tritrichomonas foetus]|eukprot:OHT03297.1 hypothetical protein TRFO_29338 [Tritrichomonas foetus]
MTSISKEIDLVSLNNNKFLGNIFYFVHTMVLLVSKIFLLVYTLIALAALAGSCIATYFLLDADFQKYFNASFSTYLMALDLCIVLSIIVTFLMVFDINFNSSRSMIYATLLLTVLTTAASLYSGIILRHSFNSCIEMFDNESYFDIQFIQKICQEYAYNSTECLNKRTEFVFKRTTESGIIVLATSIVFLFVQTGLTSQTFRRKKEIEKEQANTLELANVDENPNVGLEENLIGGERIDEQ